LHSFRRRDMFRTTKNHTEISGGLSPKFIEVRMAFCTSCGKQLAPDDRFCKGCGKPVSSAEPAAHVEAAAPQVVPSEPPKPHEPTLVIPVHPMTPVTPTSSAAPSVFCRACGKQSPASYDYCESCGAPLRGSAPAAPAPIQASAPAQQSVATPSALPPKRKSHVGLLLGVIFLALALIVVVVVLVIFSGPKPEDSLDQARTAYLQHDQANFDKYVDVNSVLSDWTDQGVNVWLKQQNAGPIETAAAQIVAGTLKGVYLPNLAQSVDQMVVSGTLPDQSQTGQNDQATVFVTSFMSSVLRNIASSQLTYQGLQSKSITNDNAELTVGVTSPLSSQPISVRIKMRRDGDHWRVVGVEDLAGLLNQINPTATPTQ
jgi:hypothetical protein